MEPVTWGSPAEIEDRRRIKLLVWAFAYERMNISLVDDHTFDQECLKVDLSIDTGNKRHDAWWREHFDPSTGQWVHRHWDQKWLEIMVNREAAFRGIAIIS